jgi:hypothetical protein
MPARLAIRNASDVAPWQSQANHPFSKLTEKKR